MTPHVNHILFFAEAVTLAHVARCITLANELFNSGKYHITIAMDGRYDDVLGATPYSRIPLYSISSRYFAKKIAQGLPIYNVKILTDYVNEDLRIIDKIQPDFIIGDFRLSLSISSRIKKIPYATITNAYWSPYADIVYPVPEIPLVKFVGAKVAQKIFDKVRPFAFALHTLAFNQVCKKFRQSKMSYDLREIYTHADYTFYADIDSLIPMKPQPAHHLFIGPILWSAVVKIPEWWESLPTDKPIIFISLGSSGDNRLLPLLLEALSQMRITVFCITAKKIAISQQWDNIFMADFLPVDIAVKKADIVITNGGSPMAYQCIAEKKYFIGLPSNLDQYLMMDVMDKAGYGRLIRSGKVNVKVIQDSVYHALSQTKEVREALDCRIDITKIMAIIDSV